MALTVGEASPHTFAAPEHERRRLGRATDPRGRPPGALGLQAGKVSLARRMRKPDRFDGARTARGREALGAAATVPEEHAGPAQLQAASATAALSQQSVWYRLMKLTNLINRPFFSRYAERYHLTINDARVLVTLASLSNAAAHELCQATGMHPMNVSRSVATLRRQGRIAERRDPQNGRRKILRLTARGWSVCRSFVPDMDRMSRFLLCSMSSLEVEFLSRLVDQLVERLESASGEDSAVALRLPPAPGSARSLR